MISSMFYPSHMLVYDNYKGFILKSSFVLSFIFTLIFFFNFSFSILKIVNVRS